MNETKVDETFDFVIVGSGGGSMCAALYMRSVGKSVVILEKTDLVGGTTARSGGVMWIPDNRFMKEAGVPDSAEAALRYLEATAGQSIDAPGTSREKRVAYVTEGPRMIDFLVAHGIKLRRAPSWPDYHDELPGSSVPGRTVLADIFDTNALGPWRSKLRPNFMTVPAYHSEGFEIATFKSSIKGKLAMLKVGLRATLAKLTGKRLTQAGGALQGRMLLASLEAGVDIRTDVAVSGFIVENGAVKGVVAQKDGRTLRIAGTLGVLVNAGGFAQNQAMRDAHIPGTSVEWTATAPGDTGEMIEQIIGLGAASGQMNERVGNQMAIPPGQANTDGQGVDLGGVAGQMNLSKPGAILVDQSGQRYLNEGGSYMAFCKAMLERNRTVPAIPSWYVFDQFHYDRYMFAGTMPGAKKPQEWYDSGFLKKADTIEELARLCGIDPASFRRTIEHFNEGARQGRDPQFKRGDRAYDNWLGDAYHKPSSALAPIERPPYYAVPMVPGDVGTYGGVVTDVHGRVMRKDGSPIEGLFATGTTTASVMGRFYPGAGSSIGPAFVFGYIAARYAAHASNLPASTAGPGSRAVTGP